MFRFAIILILASTIAVAVEDMSDPPEAIEAVKKLGGTFPFNKMLRISSEWQSGNAGLKQVNKLNSIDSIIFGTFNPPNITEEGLTELASMPNLRILSMSMKLTDKGFSAIQGLPKLEFLTNINSNY